MCYYFLCYSNLHEKKKPFDALTQITLAQGMLFLPRIDSLLGGIYKIKPLPFAKTLPQLYRISI